MISPPDASLTRILDDSLSKEFQHRLMSRTMNVTKTAKSGIDIERLPEKGVVTEAADKPMRLILEDGCELDGRGFGTQVSVAGEVVFNTAMAGYVEALTDPSYRGQILVLTYPLIGNYGVPASRAAGTLDRPFESGRIQVQGLVVQHYFERHSHSTATRSLGRWLEDEGIPAMTGVDTRGLTQRLREVGTMKGWLAPSEISNGEANRAESEVDMARVFDLVEPSEVVRYPAGDLTVLLVDVGAKDNLVRSLLERDVSVIRANWRTALRELAGEVDGLLIGNGPGDPKDLMPFVEELRSLMATYQKPIFGICLGHQILSLAAGADTFKLRYGHRGINQPVQDLLTRRCYVTSQNHGYGVLDESCPEGWEPWFVNINDGTNEGIRSLRKPFFSVQFHPEASPGPRDTAFLFDDFLRSVAAIKRG